MTAADSDGIRIDLLDRALEREIGKREQADKYTHRMIEDVQARYQEAMLSFGRIESAFRQHLDDDKKMGLGISQLDDRLRTVERLVWIAVGGIVVIGASIPIGMSIIIHYMK